MRSTRSFYILVVLTIAVVAAAVLSQRSGRESGPSYGLQLPDLREQVDAVHAVVIRTAEGTLRLERTDDGWVARSKDGYPADAVRIRHLVLGLSGLQRIEKKTSKPDRLDELELSDVDKPGSKATEITLLADDDRKLAGLLVGKTQDFQASAKSRYFVRDTGESQSWLVEGTLPPVVGDLSDWLAQKLMAEVGDSDIRSISVTQTGAQTVTVRRDSADTNDFQLAGLADDEKISNQYSVNAIPETFRRLSLKDVKTDGAVDDGEPILTVDAVTFDGVRIEARFGQLKPDYTVRLKASYDPDSDRSAEKSGSGAAGGEDESEEKKQAPGGEQLARDLNRRWGNRVFVLSQYSIDALKTKHADLVKADAGAEGSSSQ